MASVPPLPPLSPLWRVGATPGPLWGTGGPRKRRVSRPRPGHADLNGAIKYDHRDMRNVLERSSARETAARVAVGAVARQLLHHCGIDIAGHVVRIGSAGTVPTPDIPLEELRQRSEASPVRCIDKELEAKMIEVIDKAKAEGDSVGGVVEVIAEGVPSDWGVTFTGTASWTRG